MLFCEVIDTTNKSSFVKTTLCVNVGNQAVTFLSFLFRYYALKVHGLLAFQANEKKLILHPAVANRTISQYLVLVKGFSDKDELDYGRGCRHGVNSDFIMEFCAIDMAPLACILLVTDVIAKFHG